MKLNFWQWLGVVLLLVALIVYIFWDRPRRAEQEPEPATTMHMQPAPELNLTPELNLPSLVRYG